MKKTIELLRQAHATNFMLYHKTHVAHWNVTGPLFPELHIVLFQKQYKNLWKAVDTYAEKLRQLQVFTPVNMDELVGLSIIDEYTETLQAKEYIEELLGDHERFLKLLDELFKVSGVENCVGVNNFIQDRYEAHQKMAWMLRSCLKDV